MNNNKVTFIDSSIAFDTINHTILMGCFTRLSLWYGLSGVVLSWFKSYLSGTHQRVKIGDCFSSSINSFIWPNRSYLIIINKLLRVSI